MTSLSPIEILIFYLDIESQARAAMLQEIQEKLDGMVIEEVGNSAATVEQIKKLLSTLIS